MLLFTRKASLNALIAPCDLTRKHFRDVQSEIHLLSQFIALCGQSTCSSKNLFVVVQCFDYFFNLEFMLINNYDLFFCSQLFGLADADEDVSPDSADPEAIG